MCTGTVHIAANKRGMEERLVALASDCWRWIRATWVPFAAFALALVIVTFAAYQANVLAAGVAATILVLTSLVLSHLVRRERANQDYDAGRARAVVSAVELFVGIELAAWAWKG